MRRFAGSSSRRLKRLKRSSRPVRSAVLAWHSRSPGFPGFNERRHTVPVRQVPTAASQDTVASPKVASPAPLRAALARVVLDDRVLVGLVLLPMVIAALVLVERPVPLSSSRVTTVIATALPQSAMPVTAPLTAPIVAAPVGGAAPSLASALPRLGAALTPVDTPMTLAMKAAPYEPARSEMPEQVPLHDLTEAPVRVSRCVLREPEAARLAGQATGFAKVGFGDRLAEAAEAQLGQFVIYRDSYENLAYPMGDVATMYGVCTDVVIRAYRAIGVDLQALVSQAKVGSGDRNIDHRRTHILRRFFARYGQSLAVTTVADDYLPGDIVTYERPQNRGSTAHIAIVSRKRAISGRPMIIHNRGWGPQLEDALFVDAISGHYRYSGKAAPIGSRAIPAGVLATRAGSEPSIKPDKRRGVVLKPLGQRRPKLRSENAPVAKKAHVTGPNPSIR